MRLLVRQQTPSQLADLVYEGERERKIGKKERKRALGRKRKTKKCRRSQLRQTPTSSRQHEKKPNCALRHEITLQNEEQNKQSMCRNGVIGSRFAPLFANTLDSLSRTNSPVSVRRLLSQFLVLGLSFPLHIETHTGCSQTCRNCESRRKKIEPVSVTATESIQ